jgi:DNA excision repair protein ERCC-2
MSLIKLAVGDFAMPVPRVGSIETHSGFGRASEAGQEIHLQVQERRAKQEASYRSEVAISREFERGGYTFQVSGRIDGLFERTPPLAVQIEEIKSAFNVRDLARKLSEGPRTHPYCLQLRTYGYFYWLDHGVEPRLSFHLVSIRNGESLDLELSPDRVDYESWLERRLDDLACETKKWEKRAARRKKLAEKFAFPFERPRSGQVELIQRVEQGFAARERLMIQAPTGLGKTAGVLYPALKEALSRGQRVIYVTPKNSQHSVAEDAVSRFQETGTPVKSLTITAKSKICLKNEPLCNPDYCEYARDHYTKVDQNGLLEILAKKKKLNARVFRALGEEYEVCPFELQLEAAQEAEAVICDYNYVFAPRSSLGRISETRPGQSGKPNLVIDEAHNLPSRAMDYYSPALSSVTLQGMRSEIRSLPGRFRTEAEGLLDDCIQILSRCQPEPSQRARIEPPFETFLAQDAELRTFLSRYLEADYEIQPRDVVLRLCFYWSEFTAALEYVTGSDQAGFFTTFQPHPSGGTVKITCSDASPMLEECYDSYENVVAFSATLKPFDYYARLAGLDPKTVATAEFQSPFPKGHRKLLVIPQISTKFSERARNYPRIAETIQRIAAVRAGNYFAFFPSFDFLTKTLEVFDAPPGFVVLRQERDMKAPDLEAIFERLRDRTAPALIFAVQGGVFSEGVDYPGDMIIGAFVIGPPLPSFDLEREQMREYYDRTYGSGFNYAYTFPAMAKAVQAAGRVIRSETDRGIIVLMDGRFLQPEYARSMPSDWFERGPRELVSESILKEVAEFWDSCETTPS